jgi:hypothetical protein
MSSIEHPLGLNSEIHHAFSERVAWQTALVINAVRQQETLPTGQVVPPVNWRAIFGGPYGTGASLRPESSTMLPSIRASGFAVNQRPSNRSSPAPQVPEGPSDNSPAFPTPGCGREDETASRRDA